MAVALWRGATTALRNSTIQMIAPSGRQSLLDFYNDFYRPLKLRSRAVRTRELYEFTIRNFGRFLHREPTLADFTDDTVSRLLGWMMDRGLSPYSANKERSHLLAIWRFACRKGFLNHWPDVEPEIQPERVPRAWRRDELEKLFAACLGTAGRIGNVQARYWWYALHLVGWDTGERIAAIRSLRWQWVDLEGAEVRMPAEVRKGKRADRRYPLHAETVEMLRLIESPLRDLVFPWPYSPTYIYKRYSEIQKRAGLPIGRQFRFHCLRRAVASHGKAAGLDPQELMGHMDGRTTKKYLDPTICGGKSASETLFRPHKRKPEP